MIKYVIDNLATSQLREFSLKSRFFYRRTKVVKAVYFALPLCFVPEPDIHENMDVVDDDNHVRFKRIKITRILGAFVELSQGVSTDDGL